MEKNLFRIGGVYRDKGGRLVMPTEDVMVNGRAAAYGRTTDVYGRFTTHFGRNFLDDGRDCNDEGEQFHLLPGELHKVGDEWVPIESPSVSAALEKMEEAFSKTPTLPDLTRQVKELAALQLSSCDCVRDPYFRGLYNGLELALSILESRDPVYVDKPQQSAPKGIAGFALSLDGPQSFRLPQAKF